MRKTNSYYADYEIDGGGKSMTKFIKKGGVSL